MFIIISLCKCMPVKLNIIFISLLLIFNSGAVAEDNSSLDGNTIIFVPGVQRSIISTDEERVRLGELFRDIISGDIDQVKRYTYSCGDITMADMYGNTPLMIASEADRADIVELLINGKCLTNNQLPDIKRAINYKNTHGYTALYAAVMYANADVIDMLLSAGADSAIPNEYGLTPNDYVRALGFNNIAEYSVYLRSLEKRLNLDNVDFKSGTCLSTSAVSVVPTRGTDDEIETDSVRINGSMDGVVVEFMGDNASNSKINDDMIGSVEEKVNHDDVSIKESKVESLLADVMPSGGTPVGSTSVDGVPIDSTLRASSISTSLNLGSYAKRYASEWQLYLIYEERSEGFCEYSIKAIGNVKKAAEYGDIKAIYWLGKYYYDQDKSKSLKYFQDTRLEGSVYYTGVMYYMGLLYIDDKKSYSQAQSLLCTAADQGDSKAMAECGSNYLFGKATAVDSAKAYRYLAMGYDLEEPSAIYHIGLMTYYGYGVEEDKVKGLIDIKQASYHGYDPAYDHIKRLRTQEMLEYLANYKRLMRAEIRTYILSLNNAAPKERVVTDNKKLEVTDVNSAVANGSVSDSGTSVNTASDDVLLDGLVLEDLTSGEIICDTYAEGDLFSNEYMIKRIETCFAPKGVNSLKVIVDSRVHPIYKKYLVEYSNVHTDIALIFE